MNVIKARKKGSDEIVRVKVTQTHAELFGTGRAHRASPAQAKHRLVRQGYELVGKRQGRTK